MKDSLLKPSDPFVTALVSALGLPKYYTSFTLHVEVGQLVVATCTFYASLADRRTATETVGNYHFKPTEQLSAQAVQLKDGICSPEFTRSFNAWLLDTFGPRRTLRVEYDEWRDEYLIDGVRCSPQFLRAFVNPSPNQWFRVERQGDLVTISRKEAE